MEHEIVFENGRLFCRDATPGEALDPAATLDIYKKMEEYYNQACTVTFWHKKTVALQPFGIRDIGEFVQRTMRVRDAIFQIKEGYLEQATIEIDE